VSRSATGIGKHTERHSLSLTYSPVFLQRHELLRESEMLTYAKQRRRLVECRAETNSGQDMRASARRLVGLFEHYGEVVINSGNASDCLGNSGASFRRRIVLITPWLKRIVTAAPVIFIV